MNLGDILSQAAIKDLAHSNKNGISYNEFLKDENFCIKFSCKAFPEATIDCSVPDKGTDEEKNYLRLYFLSMVFNTAIHGMKRMKHKKNSKI